MQEVVIFFIMIDVFRNYLCRHICGDYDKLTTTEVLLIKKGDKYGSLLFKFI